jgi:DNA-directed RNA polymerase I and III subunit RPAC2
MEQQLERPPDKVLEILSGSDEKCATFQLTQEDHTLGNSLRYVLARSRDTDFVGYSIPHPSEPKLMLRLQTTGRPATAVFRDGLETLSSLCDHVLDTFNAAVERGPPADDVEMDA